MKPHPGNEELEGAPGAYANAVTRAVDELEFRERVTDVFADLGYDVVHVTDVEPAFQRAARNELSATLHEAACRAPHADGVFWDTFYIYESEDDE